MLVGILLGACALLCFAVTRTRQSIWCGIHAIGAALAAGGAIIALGFYVGDRIWDIAWLRTVLALALLALVLLVLAGPFLLVLTFLINGVQIVRKEGRSFSHLLSLLFSLGLIAFWGFWPMLQPLAQKHVLTKALFVYVNAVVLYTLMLLGVFFLSCVVSPFHLRREQNLDYIVVLGCGLSGRRLTPLLRGRVDEGLRLLAVNPKAKLVLSGGQGPDEEIAEAEAMAAYVREQGIDESRIIVENRSKTTEENLANSIALMQGAGRTAVVTTNYHVHRALQLARAQGLRCSGYGAKTKLYFYLNALLREFVAFVVESKRGLLTLLGLGTVGYVAACGLLMMFR